MSRNQIVPFGGGPLFWEWSHQRRWPHSRVHNSARAHHRSAKPRTGGCCGRLLLGVTGTALRRDQLREAALCGLLWVDMVVVPAAQLLWCFSGSDTLGRRKEGETSAHPRLDARSASDFRTQSPNLPLSLAKRYLTMFCTNTLFPYRHVRGEYPGC